MPHICMSLGKCVGVGGGTSDKSLRHDLSTLSRVARAGGRSYIDQGTGWEEKEDGREGKRREEVECVPSRSGHSLR